MPEASWDFARTAKLSPDNPRSVALGEFERRVRPVLRQVPITRIADLTPLDPLRLPVFIAVTPLARDLTTHAGKGVDAASARMSAIMEAVERVSAEEAPGATHRAPYGEARAGGRDYIDPTLFDLPHAATPPPEAVLSFCESFDLLARRAVLMPTDLVVSPPRGELMTHPDTNGLASGSNLLEAVVHGLCEVVERDAVSQLEFVTRYGDDAAAVAGRVIDPTTLPPAAAAWFERIRSLDLQLVVEDISNDLSVPTFRATLVDEAFPAARGLARAYFPGFGAHPNARIAVVRSITEAVQARLGVIQGARDSFNVLPTTRRRATQRHRLGPFLARPSLPFDSVTSYAPATLNEDLAFLLERLQAVGSSCAVVTDLTRPRFGLPVVRVRVPGLSTFVSARHRVGWRCLRHLI